MTQRTTQQNKVCALCGTLFRKAVKYSQHQWDCRKYCSMVCSSEAKIGTTHTPEVRARLSLIHKGTKKPWAGKYIHSEAQRQNTSVSLKKFYSLHPEAREKLSSLALGRKHTEQAKENMRQAQRQLPTYRGGLETRRKRRVFYESTRRARKFGNGGSHTQQQWEDLKKEFNFTCLSCKLSEPEIKLTKDHIIPLANGGSDSIHNLQPLCFSCNCKKHTDIIGWIIRYQPNQERFEIVKRK